MSATEIKAIETEYAGCRFRSRLEARWAVFLDHLGVKWLYEPQGYVLGDGERYLPDFWLPDLQLWVEVKGAPSQADWIKLYAASDVDGLPTAYEGGQSPLQVLGELWVHRLPVPLGRVLILGEIPRPLPGNGWVHIVTTLDSHGPGYSENFFWGRTAYQIGPTYPWPAGIAFFGANLLGGRELEVAKSDASVHHAYDAARKARFEHGERG